MIQPELAQPHIATRLKLLNLVLTVQIQEMLEAATIAATRTQPMQDSILIWEVKNQPTLYTTAQDKLSPKEIIQVVCF